MFHEIYMMQNTVVLSLYPSIHLLLFPCQFMGLGWGLEAGYNFYEQSKDESFQRSFDISMIGGGGLIQSDII